MVGFMRACLATPPRNQETRENFSQVQVQQHLPVPKIDHSRLWKIKFASDEYGAFGSTPHIEGAIMGQAQRRYAE